MKRLRRLDAGGCGIDQDGIEGLDLYELNAWGNPKITSVYHMEKLRRLYVGWNSGIDQKEIDKLDLEELDAWGNQKITSVF